MVPPALGDGRRPAFPPALRGYGQRGVHTRAHTPESMLSAGLGTSCRVASGPGPLSPPAALQVGGGGCWSRGRGPRLSPFGVLVPGIAFARPAAFLSSAAPAAGNRGADVIPAPRGQVAGRVARGLVVRPPARRTRSGCALHAHRPRAVSRLGGRGCVSAGPLAHYSLSRHTQSLGFIATARWREEVPFAFGAPPGCWVLG